MTTKEIQKYINKIKEEIKNPEAHMIEDVLRDVFIKYISKRKDLIGEKARLVISTNNLPVDRWYE